MARNRVMLRIPAYLNVSLSLLGAGYTTSIPDTDPRLISLRPPLDAHLRAKAKEVLIEDELAKRR